MPIRANRTMLGPSMLVRLMVPEMPENHRARGRAIEGATSRESGRVMKALENNVNGWEANENRSGRST